MFLSQDFLLLYITGHQAEYIVSKDMRLLKWDLQVGRNWKTIE